MHGTWSISNGLHYCTVYIPLHVRLKHAIFRATQCYNVEVINQPINRPTDRSTGRPDQTIHPNQTKPNQTKPNQTNQPTNRPTDRTRPQHTTHPKSNPNPNQTNQPINQSTDQPRPDHTTPHKPKPTNQRVEPMRSRVLLTKE